MSLWSLHYHLVFSTKERRALIENQWRDRLHAWLGGAVRTMGGVAEAVGGVEDHVHLLVGLRGTHCLSEVLRELKASSSAWVHRDVKRPLFAWQDGYGAFTVSQSQRPRVRRYIERQEEHHRRRSFLEEYRELLRRNGVEFDERDLA